MATSVGAQGHLVVGSKTVTTAGTRVTIESTVPRVSSLTIVAKDNNTGRIYVGGDDVASTTNRGLAAGDSVTFTAPKLELDTIYLDASVSGEGVDWYAVI